MQIAEHESNNSNFLPALCSGHKNCYRNAHVMASLDYVISSHNLHYLHFFQ